MGHFFGAYQLHDLGGDGVLGIHQALAQCQGRAARTAAIGGPPESAVAQRNFHIPIDKGVGGFGAVFKRRAVHKGLEGRAGLPVRLLDVVKLVLREVAAADPGAHLSVARVYRQKSGLQTRFFVV